jgi:hypothetical protein
VLKVSSRTSRGRLPETLRGVAPSVTINSLAGIIKRALPEASISRITRLRNI